MGPQSSGFLREDAPSWGSEPSREAEKEEEPLRSPCQTVAPRSTLGQVSSRLNGVCDDFTSPCLGLTLPELQVPIKSSVSFRNPAGHSPAESIVMWLLQCQCLRNFVAPFAVQCHSRIRIALQNLRVSHHISAAKRIELWDQHHSAIRSRRPISWV